MIFLNKRKKMGLKKSLGINLVLFSIVLLTGMFFLSQNVSAQVTCSSSSQIILRLSASTNAHGEVFNGGGSYSTEICYDTLFGTTGTGNRVCSGTNNVVGLSASTNAHAEGPTQNNYGTEVCYDDLSCVARSGACQAGETLVVSLSGSTNAHLATSGYGTNICCSAEEIIIPAECVLTSASWSTLTATEGQAVNLNVQGTDCDGESIAFEVLEYDVTSGDDPVNIEPSNVVFNGNSATGSWTAEFQDDGIGGGDPEYHFIVTLVSDPGETIDSGTASDELLVVSEEPGDPGEECDNINVCNDYGDEPSCTLDDCEVADNSVPNEIDCTEVNCFCYWDAGTTPQCNAGWDGTSGTCGNGVIEPGEECDGGTSLTCTDIGLSGSGLTCTSECRLDSSACTGPTGGSCGDGIVQVGETCDPGVGLSLTCTDLGFDNGGPPTCVEGECYIDTTQCTLTGIPGLIGSCRYTSTGTGDTCDDGFLTIDYTATWTWDPDNTAPPPSPGPGWVLGTDGQYHYDPDGLSAQCQSVMETLACPAQIALPFFGFYNVIIALMIIGLVYWVLALNRKHRK